MEKDTLIDPYVCFNRNALQDLRNDAERQFGTFPELRLVDRRIALLEKIIHISPPIPEMTEQLQQTLNRNPFFMDAEHCKQWIIKHLRDDILGISAIIITRNEERSISRCLNSLMNHVEEIIVIDTGSTDNTMNIVASYPSHKVKLYEEQWNDHFAEARNAGIEKATYEWILFVDSDEWLSEEQEDINLINDLIHMFNHFPQKQQLTLCPTIINSSDHKSVGVKRIFSKSSGITFSGAVHEYPTTPDGNANLQSISIDLKLEHDGYQEEIIEAKQKFQRNVTLLEQMLSQEPNNPRWYYFLARDGRSLLPAERIEALIHKGIELYQKQHVNEDQDFTASLVDLLLQLKFHQEKFEDVYEIALQLNSYKPNNSNSVFFSAMSKMFEQRRELGMLLEHTVHYRENDRDPQYGMLQPNGEHIDLLIGVLLFELGMYDNAIKYFDFLEEIFSQHPIFQLYQSKINNMKKAIRQDV